MIIPASGRVVWTNTDAAQLQAFLETTTGQRFVLKLFAFRPLHKPFESIELRAVESGMVEGYEECIKDISQLTEIKN